MVYPFKNPLKENSLLKKTNKGDKEGVKKKKQGFFFF